MFWIKRGNTIEIYDQENNSNRVWFEARIGENNALNVNMDKQDFERACLAWMASHKEQSPAA